MLIADHIYTPDGFQNGKAIVFDSTVLAIDTPEKLLQQFPALQPIHTPPGTVLYPGLINPHVHLEFSANRTTLSYGDFMTWLHSVIAHRDTLVNACDATIMQEAVHVMLRSGITTFGAISSFGNDLEVCRQTPQRVVYYNELIGSAAASADVLYGDFLERVSQSQQSSPEDRLVPAVAIHAPYSVHPILLHKAIALARTRQMPLSTHFLESPAEREWLESHSGGFLGFFQKFFNTDRSVTTIDEFLHAFDQYPTLFVHCTQTTSAEREHLAAHGHTIAHCPRSNRLLNCGRLPVEDLHGAPRLQPTDSVQTGHSASGMRCGQHSCCIIIWILNLWLDG